MQPLLKKRPFPNEVSLSKVAKLVGGNVDEGNVSTDSSLLLQQQRKSLPIWSARKKFLKEVVANNTLIVIGETGCGKTTQIPQFLYEAGLHRGSVIACTQPRRVAAVTVAERVAEEKNSPLGKLVGYSVRFDDTCTSSTKIKYMTDGMMLREAIIDPHLKRYGIIILDEAHERTVHTDVLFGIIKNAQVQRRIRKLSPLKIIVMSATMDVDQFSKYFDNAPVIYIQGRQYPVDVMYAAEPQSDYLFSCLVTIFQIHQSAPPKDDILLFLTGQEEIESTVKSIKEISTTLNDDLPKLIVRPLYGSLPPSQQMKVFQNTPEGHRKVIVSTNIAETSVTIHGIKYVVDSGMVKAKIFVPSNGMELLKVCRISQAQGWQRTGRAGRERAGICYRLFTERQFDELPAATVPEVQRCNLASVILQLLAMGITNIHEFDFMDKPDTASVDCAIEQLILLDAVEKTESGSLKLTPIGHLMSSFPLDPRFCKSILSSKDNGCLQEILSIVSMLSVESIIISNAQKRDEAISAHQKFLSSEGDHITLLNMYRAFKKTGGNSTWCRENYLNFKNLNSACEVRKQLRDICIQHEFPLESCNQNMSIIRKCITAGFFMNSAELHSDGQYQTTAHRKLVHFHPSSSLFQHKPAYIVYNELVKTNKTYIREICTVDPEWLYEVAPDYFRKHRLSKNT